VRERTIRFDCAAKEEIDVGCQMLDVRG